MFKETKEGQTHSFNDGCGEPEHNVQIKCLNKTSKKDLEKILKWAEMQICEFEAFIKTIKKELKGRK